ncbi:MAG TPA: mechanosensitive ion channel domain-containing protein [Solirubrobacterales bacterium]|nr:mechanosensitive ion channel domain-containing protein [Solirubrobacterales bacterium]
MRPAVSQVVLLAQENADPSFWQDHGDEVSAAITLLVAVVVAFLVDRLVIARGARVAERMSDTGMTRTTQTRLRVIRRLVFVAILVIGIALALSQFAQIKRLATGILASSAVLGLVIGLAARQTLGNLVAGVMLAVTQPIRIGDRVTFEEVTGRVDDLTLSYTYIDPGNGDLVVVPNEKIVSGELTNHSTGDRGAPVTIKALLPADADVAKAEEVLKRDAGADAVRLSDWTADGLVLEVKVGVGQHRTRVGDEEAALRERSQRALQAAGILASER